jgi:hypothetical protein
MIGNHSMNLDRVAAASMSTSGPTATVAILACAFTIYRIGAGLSSVIPLSTIHSEAEHWRGVSLNGTILSG